MVCAQSRRDRMTRSGVAPQVGLEPTTLRLTAGFFALCRDLLHVAGGCRTAPFSKGVKNLPLAGTCPVLQGVSGSCGAQKARKRQRGSRRVEGRGRRRRSGAGRRVRSGLLGCESLPQGRGPHMVRASGNPVGFRTCWARIGERRLSCPSRRPSRSRPAQPRVEDLLGAPPRSASVPTSFRKRVVRRVIRRVKSSARAQ